MTTKTPASIKARRACVLNGVSYAKNQVLTSAQVLGIPHLSALLSNGVLEAVPDIHRRTVGRAGRQPTKLHPVMLKALTTDYDTGTGGEQNMNAVASVDGHQLTMAITGGAPPYHFNWGGGVLTDENDRSASHVYPTTGAKTCTVTDSDGNTDTDGGTIAAIGVVATPGAGHSATIVVTNARAPIYIDWGDASNAHVQLTHSYASAGTYTITVTDADGFTGTTPVTVT